MIDLISFLECDFKGVDILSLIHSFAHGSDNIIPGGRFWNFPGKQFERLNI